MSRVLLFALMLTAASMTSFGQAATPAKYPCIVTDLRLTAQTETIPMTTFFTPKTDGIYRVSHQAFQDARSFYAIHHWH
jgi:hypothetical protein